MKTANWVQKQNAFLPHAASSWEPQATMQEHLRPSDMVQKIRQVHPPRPERLDDLITFGLAVQHLCSQLSSDDRKHYLANHELLKELVDKQPASRQLNWGIYKPAIQAKRPIEPTLYEFGLCNCN